VAKRGIRAFTSTEEAVAALQKQRYRAMTEEQLLQDVRRFLTLQGWKHWHVRYSKGSDPGWPDLYAIHKGHKRTALIETKSERGVLTREQGLTLALVFDLGEPYEPYVIRPSTWNDYLPGFASALRPARRWLETNLQAEVDRASKKGERWLP
jgi:hypothetical protein